MMGLKLNRRNGAFKGLSVCLLIVLLMSVLITSASARYMTTGRTTATFTPVGKAQSLYLFAGRNADGTGTPLEALDGTMQFFCVSNAETQQAFEECDHLTFRVRLYLRKTEEITQPPYLLLQSGSELGEWGAELRADPQRLDDRSALAIVEGPGWIYTFCDAAGDEVLFTLPGNEFLNQYFVLRVSDGSFSQFQLKVELVRAGSEVEQ